jgi:hypothetical protein
MLGVGGMGAVYRNLDSAAAARRGQQGFHQTQEFSRSLPRIAGNAKAANCSDELAGDATEVISRYS